MSVKQHSRYTYTTVVNGRLCSLHCRSFGHAWVHPVKLSTLHTTADIVLEIVNTSTAIEYDTDVNNVAGKKSH